MKKLFLLIESIFLYAGILPGSAQAKYAGGVNIQSPQVWSFMKYSDIKSVNNNTGTVFIHIPVYTYKDKDFEIPISIDYASNGYVPNVQTGVLGLGWILNAGGCITREVKGIPDDKQMNAGSMFLRNGYLYQHLSTNAPTSNWNNIIDYNHGLISRGTEYCFPPANDGANSTETQSDIYHFRFGEHRGSFMLGPNKKVYIYDTTKPSGEYKIDLTRMQYYYEITISTGDGYKYYFNSFRFLDYVLPDEDSKIASVNYNLSWMLAKIVAPNGRQATLKYSLKDNYSLWKPMAYIAGANEDSYIHTPNNWLSAFQQASSYSAEATLNYAKQTLCNLDQINIADEVKIEFVYESKHQEKCIGLARVPVNIQNLGQLKNIQVIDANSKSVLQDCLMTYYVNSTPNGNPITFLDKLAFLNGELYSFDYYDKGGWFPYHGTVHFDHWGFNNSTSDYTYNYNRLIPDLTVDATYNEKILSNQREPNVLGARMGMLKKIVYPTKGCTEFQYEGHTYSSKIGRTYLSYGNQTILTSNTGGYTYSDPGKYPAGGVRIKQITNYFGNGVNSSKKYYYTNTDGRSTGILSHFPRYLEAVSLHSNNTSGYAYYNTCIRSSTDLSVLSETQSHIGYSKVREENSDGSYTDYFYTDYSNNPDDTSVSLLLPQIQNGATTEVSYPQFAQNLFREPLSFHARRGLLLRELTYDREQTLVRKQTYSYQSVPVFSECLKSMWGYVYVHKTFVGSIQKQEELSVIYLSDNDSTRTKTTYSYNSLGQICMERQDNMSGSSVAKRRIFPQDMSGQDYSYIYSEGYWLLMMIDNYLCKPLIEARYVNDELTSAVRYRYVMQNSLVGRYYNINSVFSSELSSSVLLHSNIRSDVFSPEPDISFDFFDKYGNAVQTTTKSGEVTTYVWGYKGKYIVAKISNMKYETVKKILGEGLFEQNTLIADNLTEEAKAFLRKTPAVLVTTYTYTPFVGMTSQTDPSGKTTYYEYDRAGRLISVKDHQKNIRESYEYHYAN